MIETTLIPRWNSDPGSGCGEAATALPVDVEALAGTFGVAARDVLRTAYTRVVGLLAVEDAVSVAWSRDDASVVLARVELGDSTWRELVRAVAGAPTTPAGPDAAGRVDAVFGDLPGVPLAVRHEDGAVRVRFDRGEYDHGHAERVGGYLAAALQAMAADPDAPHSRADLLSEAERHHQLAELNGPDREIPDVPFHEVFAARVREHPDRLAAICGEREWTYADLDAAANRVAHTLLADGLRPGGTVCVAAERGLPWMAAIVGVFKAGGVYLPVEAEWPAARVAELIGRSGARHVVTEPGSHPARELCPDASWRVAAEIVDDAGIRHDDPGVAVAKGDAAYIYFTSGSTGRPKGATIEHLGMLNHLYAKIDDLRIGARDVVVQSTQSSFDISLWQLIAGLLVGARTVIIPKREALDVPRFLDVLRERGATVVQVVPSYLDVMIAHAAARPRPAGPLREVSVTGEAITRPLIARWFEQFPGVRLINAYGATEVSDDATHEIFSAPPPDDVVPVGRALNNVLVSVLGPGDRLVPLGSPGEITFSGMCVGRGYINDPERTAAAFQEDPHRPGVRMYRTGDFGRFLPDGKLGFHGRRDEQVKVHGIRIELGEVESRLLEHPAVRGGSVVAVPTAGLGKELVGFYVDGGGDGGLTPDALREHLARVLPAGYVPGRLCRLDALPLTPNGKVDKRALINRAAEAAADDPPATAAERRIAQAWAKVLGTPQDRIGRGDRFFVLGGSSLGALRMVAALEGTVALADVLRDPTLAELAVAPAAAGTAPVPDQVEVAP